MWEEYLELVRQLHPSIEGNTEVEFVIGLDHPKGLVQLGVRWRSNGEPFSLRTHLSWIVLDTMVH